MHIWETLTVEQAEAVARDMQREIDDHAKYCGDELQRADMRAEMRDGVAFTLAHLAGLDISYARRITGFFAAQDEYYTLKESQREERRANGYGIDARELERAAYDFNKYMTAGRWDRCKAGGIYADDGTRAVGCFVEFIETGTVTNDDGGEQ